MKSFNKFLLLAFSLAIFSTSCSSDDDASFIPTLPATPAQAYENGYFVLNEGGSSATTSGIDFISYGGVQTEDVFRKENATTPEIGSYLQNIFFDATRAFIISGSTDTVTIVNRFNFQYIGTVTIDLNNPRYGVVVNGKAYVTNQATFGTGTDDFVTVIDLSNYTTSKIMVGDYMNRIASVGDKVIVANEAFGSGNGITFINTADNTFTSLDLGSGNGPNTIEVANNTLYALTNSKKVIEINPTTQTVTSTLDLPASLPATKNLQIVNGEAYFTADKSVYTFTLGATTVSSTPVLTYASTSAWGAMYGFAVSGKKIYIGDAGDFASSGTTFEYTLDGKLITSYTSSGIGPNGFYFN